MNRLKIISYLLIALVLLSCNLVSGNGTPAAPSPVVKASATVEKAVAADLATATLPPTQAAPATEAATEAPTLAPSDTAVPPTETATTIPTPSEFVDEFDRSSDVWTEPIVVTTQALPNQFFSKVGLETGKFQFKVADKETYMYVFHMFPFGKNVEISATYQSIGYTENGISLTCRVNPAFTSWYEFRVSSVGNYSIFQYDKDLKVKQGKNPYVLLKKAGVESKIIFPTDVNVIKVTCEDTQLTLDINKGKQVVVVPLDKPLEGDLIGMGAMSYGLVPVVINFDQLVVKPINP